MSWRRLILLTLCLTLPLALLACGADDDDDDSEPTSTPTAVPSESPTASPDDPVVGTPDDGPAQLLAVALVEARQDLANRLGIEPLDVTLASLEAAGWNGCLGVIRPEEACTEQFVGGTIAMLEANGEMYRYHIGGEKLIPVSFLEGEFEVEDGMEVPPEIAPDFSRDLAAWSRNDLALRLGVEPSDVTVTAIAPVMFTDSCLGMMSPAMSCMREDIPGFVVMLAAPDGEYRYHASVKGIVATDFAEGEVIELEDPADIAAQQAMREDLAGRLDAMADEIGVVSYRLVTWPDSCLGVARPDMACAAVLTDGFLAQLVGPDRLVYTYHGAGDQFIATDFEPDDAQINPFPTPRTPTAAAGE